jgi:hypothetical protein
MPITSYDPECAPDPKEWLSLAESERIRLAQSFHVSARIKTPNLQAHAAFHTVVENQIATGFGPSCRAVERLQKEGLSRHEAIHAVCSVVAKFLQEILSDPGTASTDTMQSRMNAEIESLSATQWRAGNDT